MTGAIALACIVFGALSYLAPAVSQEKPSTSIPPRVLSTPAATPASAPAAVPAAPAAPAAAAAPTAATPSPSANTTVAPAPSAAEERANAPKQIALVLPLSSKALGKASEAVRAGFLAAAEASSKSKFAPRIYLAEDEGASLAQQYRKALKDDAVAIVGGLTRDGASVVAREAGYLPTLALNQPTESTNLDANNFFYVTLSFDSDARLIARAAFTAGLRNIAIVSAASPLARRIQDVFEKEWTRLGGTVAAKVQTTGVLEDGPKLRAAMEKPDAAKAEAVFLAAERNIARASRPFLPQGLPVYVTAQSIDPRAEAVENLDLDMVRYVEMPWFVERDHAAVMTYPRPVDDMPSEYERLYALGIDAWRIAYALLDAKAAASADLRAEARAEMRGDVRGDVRGEVRTDPRSASRGRPQVAPIDGVTGKLSQDGNQFTRSPSLVELRDGRPQLVKTGE